MVGRDTLIRWHRELLGGRRRRRTHRPGRPPLDPSISSLILRLGRENPRWGYLRIRGELLKLGVDVSATTIATVLRQNGLGPAPRRIGPTWTQFLRLQTYGLLSPGAPSEEGKGLEELVAVQQGERPAPLSDGPATADSDADADEPVPDACRGPKGQLIPTVGALPRASATRVPPRAGTRARDGPAMAA
jgi:hypothetical protein